MPALCGCLALLLLASACKQQTPPDTRIADQIAVLAADSQWSQKAAANDLEGTISYYSEDASLLPPNAPIATGTPAIRAVWASLLGSGAAVSWQASKVQVARSGELAYVVGIYKLTMKDPQSIPVTDHGKFVEIWKKQTDGKWKVVTDMFSSDLPVSASAPVPAEKKK